MSHRTQVALLALSMLLAGVQLGSPAVAAQDHERAQGERPAGRPGGSERPEGRPSGGTRPGREGQPAFDGRGQILDQRYNHGRYYPPMGTVRPTLPGEYRPYYRGRDRYYFNGGVWYAPRGPGFVVVRPPAGLMISVLPPYYSTVWIGGSPYYYADNVYYTWRPDQNGYAVVDPPELGGGVQSADVDRIRNNYDRAMSACLQGRGYQVN